MFEDETTPTDVGADVAAIVNQGFGDPAPMSETAPAATPDPTTTAPEQQAQPDAQGSQSGQPGEGEDFWSQFLQDEPAEAPDPWAKFTAEGLDQLNDPQALRQALMDRQQFIDGQRDRVTGLGKYEKLAEAIGGEESAAKAFSWAQSLMFGRQPLPDNPQYTYLDKFLYDLYQFHEPTYRNLVSRAIEPMLSPESGKDYERIRTKVFENEGLPLTMIDDFKLVARSGGVANVALGEEAEFLQQIPQHLHQMFKEMPPEVRSDYIKNRSLAAAKYDLEDKHKTYQRDQRDAEYRAEIERQARVERAEKNEQAFFDVTAVAFETLAKQFQAKGLDELRAAGAAALAVMQIERSYWSGDRNIRAIFQQLRDQIREGNDAGIKSGRNQYLKLLTDAGRSGLRERAQKYVKKPGATTTKVPPGAPGAPQFPADRQTTDQLPDDIPAEIQQIMLRHGFGS